MNSKVKVAIVSALAVMLISSVILTVSALAALKPTVVMESGWDSPLQTLTFVGDGGMVELAEEYGIFGPEVRLEGVYPGWYGVAPITIINGADKQRTFRITIERPESPSDGFVPLEFSHWMYVPGGNITLAAGENFEVPIFLSVPRDAVMPEKSEVHIRVDDVTQEGLVRTAYISKWFIIGG